MQEIEHFNSLFIYRRDLLQKVSNALSRMLGLVQKGESTDTERFYIIHEFLMKIDVLVKHENRSDAMKTDKSKVSKTPRKNRFAEKYSQIRRYLKASRIMKDASDELKKEASNYEAKDGILYNLALKTEVLIDMKKFEKVVKAIHKNLSHYDTGTTMNAMRTRYEVASNL